MLLKSCRLLVTEDAQDYCRSRKGIKSMLVLSRKEDQKVCFPSLGITVQILRVNGSSVRLGIDAPIEVRIIRDELDKTDSVKASSHSYVIRLPQDLRHELRNELNSLSIALHLFKQELEAGYVDDAEATFERLVQHLERISANKVLSPGGTPNITNKLTALLVEDEPNEREMLAGFLRMQGYRVVTASDGLEAIDYLESNEKPSVLLMDMRMPRCDGPTTIRRIRENTAFDDIKIFAISGSSPEENHINATEDGVNGWFMKPLNPRSLVDAMANTVSKPETVTA
jgi:carbon storage regulator CsrA